MSFDQAAAPSLSPIESPSTATSPSSPSSATARPHRRKQPADHVPRAPNAFIFFRSHFYETVGTRGGDQRTVSRVAGAAWHGLAPEEKRVWHTRAAEAREAHAARFPGYRFNPNPREVCGVPGVAARQGRRPGPVPPGAKERKRIRERCERVAGLFLEDREGNREKVVKEMMNVDEMCNPQRMKDNSSKAGHGSQDDVQASLSDEHSHQNQDSEFLEDGSPKRSSTTLPSFWEGFGSVLANEYSYAPDAYRAWRPSADNAKNSNLKQENWAVSYERYEEDYSTFDEAENDLLLPDYHSDAFHHRSDDEYVHSDR